MWTRCSYTFFLPPPLNSADCFPCTSHGTLFLFGESCPSLVCLLEKRQLSISPGLPAPNTRSHMHSLLPQNGWALVINQKRTGRLTCGFSEENTAQTDIFKLVFFFFYKDSSDQRPGWVRRHLRGGDPASHTYARWPNREQASSVNGEWYIRRRRVETDRQKKKKAEPLDHTDKRVCSVLFPPERS